MGLSLVIALAVAGLITAGALFIPEKLICFYTRDRAVITAGGIYLRSIALSYPVLAVTFVFSFTLRSIEQARIPMSATAAALVINGVCNFLLIFGVSRGGRQIIPALGIQGAGMATVISRFVECALLLTVVYAKGLPVAGTLRSFFSFNRFMVKRHAKITAPVILNETLWSLGITMHNFVFAHAGTLALASFNIAGTVNQLTWVFFMGFGNAAAVMVGKRIGEGNNDGARKAALGCSTMMPLAACFVGLLLFPLARLLPLFFTVEGTVIAQARYMLYALICLYPLRSFNLCVLIGVERAGGDTLYCAVSDLSFLWLLSIPAGAFLAFAVHAEPWVIFLGLCTEDLFKAIACFVRLRSGKWLHNVVNPE
jgi:putative MATE family efflux protein